MERKGTTFLSNGNAFPELICLSPATCLNGGARISRSAVSDARRHGGNHSLALTVLPPLTQLSQLGEKNEQYQCRYSESLHYTALAGRRGIFSGAVIRGGFCGGRSSLSWRARSFWSAVISV